METEAFKKGLFIKAPSLSQCQEGHFKKTEGWGSLTPPPFHHSQQGADHPPAMHPQKDLVPGAPTSREPGLAEPAPLPRRANPRVQPAARGISPFTCSLPAFIGQHFSATFGCERSFVWTSRRESFLAAPCLLSCFPWCFGFFSPLCLLPQEPRH